MTRRVHYILLGILGGLAFWALSEMPADLRTARLFLPVTIFTGVSYNFV